MSNFTEHCKMYTANEEEIIKKLEELAPLLRERERLEKVEPSLTHIRASEIKIRRLNKEEEAEKEKRSKEKEERKRKAEAALNDLGSTRAKRGGVDPPKAPSSRTLDNTSNTY